MDTHQKTFGNVERLGNGASSEILDDLERVHLQIHLLEFRSRERLDSLNTVGDRLSELADEVKSLKNRIAILHRNSEEECATAKGVADA